MVSSIAPKSIMVPSAMVPSAMVPNAMAPKLSARAESLLKETGDNAPSEIGDLEKTKTASKTKDAAAQFEALLLQQMFQGMWSTVPDSGILSGSQEEGYYKDMLNEALAQSISKGQGIGIKDVLAKDMEAIEKKKQ